MTIYLRLLSYFKKYWFYILGAMFCVLIYSASNIVYMPLVRNITTAVGKGSKGYFQNWVIDAVLLLLVQSIAKYGKNYLMAVVGQRMLVDIRIQLYKTIQILSLDFFNKWRSGDIISRTTMDTQLVKSTIVDFFAVLLPNILTAVGVLIYLFRINTKYALFVLLVVPVYGYFVGRIGHTLKLLSIQSQEKIANVLVILQETISNISLVRAFTMEKHEIKKYTKENNKNLRLELRQVRIGELRDPIMSFLNVLLVIVILWLGGNEVISGKLSYDRLAEFLTGIILLPSSLLSISKVFVGLQKSLGGAERFFEIIDMKPTVVETKNPKILKNVEGQIDFKNVFFKYDKNDEYVLKDINLSAKKGELIALVGKSGAGKTTMVNLIPRFFDPIEGAVFMDNVNIKDISLLNLRKNIGMVQQESMLFNATIKENISYGRSDASFEEIIAASKDANAHKFISLFPEAYDTFIGDRGVRLSGGQRQRISIARAILKNPKILILDEATSSLDTESERLVQEALELLMKDRTTFVIAHRLSTIIRADKIVVISGGNIVEVGNHKELIAKQGAYKKLYDIQFRA